MSSYFPGYNETIGNIASITITSTTGKILNLKIGETNLRQLRQLYELCTETEIESDEKNAELRGELYDALLHQLQTAHVIEETKARDVKRAAAPAADTDSDIPF